MDFPIDSVVVGYPRSSSISLYGHKYTVWLSGNGIDLKVLLVIRNEDGAIVWHPTDSEIVTDEFRKLSHTLQILVLGNEAHAVPLDKVNLAVIVLGFATSSIEVTSSVTSPSVASYAVTRVLTGIYYDETLKEIIVDAVDLANQNPTIINIGLDITAWARSTNNPVPPVPHLPSLGDPDE